MMERFFRNKFYKFAAITLILVMTITGLTGCGKTQKFKLDLEGRDSSFQDVKASGYEPGEEVRIVFNVIATDTDYSFFVDDKPAQVDYRDTEGYIITFTMPQHDVRVSVKSVNSMDMVMEEPENGTEAEKPEEKASEEKTSAEKKKPEQKENDQKKEESAKVEAGIGADLLSVDYAKNVKVDAGKTISYEVDSEGNYGVEVAFSAEKEVYNVKLQSLSFQDVDEAGNVLYDTALVHSWETLQPGQTLIVRMRLPETFPIYQISYEDAEGKNFAYSVNESGKDGSLFLSQMGQDTTSVGEAELGEVVVQLNHPDVDSDFKSVIGDWVLVSVTSYDDGTSYDAFEKGVNEYLSIYSDLTFDFERIVGDSFLQMYGEQGELLYGDQYYFIVKSDEGTSHLYAIGVDADHHLRVDESFLKPDGTYEGNVRIYTRY